MAFAFDESPTPELPGTFIFDDFEDNNGLGFDPSALDDLPECFPLDTPSSNIFEEPSLTPSGSSAYGCGDWETLTPEEVLKSQVSVKPKTHVQDTGLEGSKSLGPPENAPVLGMESTWDLSMNPVKSRKNRPKTKKQRAATSFVRKYGACSVHKKAKKSVSAHSQCQRLGENHLIFSIVCMQPSSHPEACRGYARNSRYRPAKYCSCKSDPRIHDTLFSQGSIKAKNHSSRRSSHSQSSLSSPKDPLNPTRLINAPPSTKRLPS